jgi:peroxin-5
LFQSRNPYAQEEMNEAHKGREGRESPTIRVSSLEHCQESKLILQGVLELEAAVQADPTDHSAWYALGLKQQENERESAAILALAKVVQLDPDYRPAYLALAVSYTNEGELQMANTMIGKWIDLAPMASQLSAGVNKSDMGEGDWREGQKVLVERLIGLARMSPEELDPDVQVALGVLFNSGEQYDKAEDCLLAALSVRPNVSSVFLYFY